MKVCGQTLILVDSDITVSGVNKQIIDATLKYMLNNSPDNRAFCISPYKHDIDWEEYYSLDCAYNLERVDKIVFEDKDSNLTDTLCSVIKRWKEADFACRDIVVFTDGLEADSTQYEREELLYLVNNSNYPIYVVDLVQENNALAKKELSTLATISDGALFLSEFDGDDAGVDKQIAESIFAKMDEYAVREWQIYDAKENFESESHDTDTSSSDSNMQEVVTQTDEVGNVDGEISLAGLTDEYTEKSEIVYRDDSNASYAYGPRFVTLAIIISMLFFTSALIIGLIVMRCRRKIACKEKSINKKVGENTKDPIFFDMKGINLEVENNNMLDQNQTVLLDYYDNDSDTVLLTESSRRVELIDSNGSNSISMIVDYPCIVGRKSDSCTCCIHDESISKQHCEIGYVNGNYYIKDLSSANGTFVNEIRVDSSYISSGDIVRLGKVKYMVKCYE